MEVEKSNGYGVAISDLEIMYQVMETKSTEAFAKSSPEPGTIG